MGMGNREDPTSRIKYERCVVLLIFGPKYGHCKANKQANRQKPDKGETKQKNYRSYCNKNGFTFSYN